ncbi:MAG: imidazole glycerol phosphate synthase subunit HisF [Candidatus Thermoplasmatota archaeon]|nr:imidazole glycerol phosphate synthase subunit HisF [Candidatus Thermoplasmatota archaeon]MBS3789972.1 imidazole glycerol phosphate synthase subunit HisF [Candidatus Thermoplasmatota archaeon]
MLAKRIVAALDIKNGRVVKGVNFENIRDAGDPVELAKRYEDEGVDEIVFLDISATNENREILIGLAKKIAGEINIPFTVGGGLSSTDLMTEMIRQGADKVFVNTAAVEDPQIIKKASKKIGASNLVIAIDAKRKEDDWKIYTHGGNKKRGLNAVEWAKKVERLGAGEILLTSMDRDGTKDGFDIPLLKKVSSAVDIPVIASGGAGSAEDFYEVFNETEVSAALAASIFHYKECSISDLKSDLDKRGINVRN